MTSSPITSFPIIGVSADLKNTEGQPFHAVGDKYLQAIVQAAQAAPLIIPALAELDIAQLVKQLDGVFLTGSLSNMHPSHYGVTATIEHEPFDPARDQLTLRLIEQALAQDIPLFAVCRGFQELNVALGGTLHPAIHKLPGKLDHRVPKSDDMAVKYGIQHSIRFAPESQFAQILDTTGIEVNSLHRQGIDQLAPDLIAEGWAPDDQIEAVRVKSAQGFALGVQWHPEYQACDNSVSLKLFQAFGRAAQIRANERADMI